jgi:hypothetical protein
VTRGDALVHSRSYAIRHTARNTSYTVEQRVDGIQAEQRYAVEGWVKIWPTSDQFTFRIESRWRTVGNASLGTSVVQTYSAATARWAQTATKAMAPARAASRRSASLCALRHCTGASVGAWP